MSKHFEKGKKDARRFDDRDSFREDQKKKKLKPVEKSKYRLKGYEPDDDNSGW